jgi:hypothetical protein
LRQRLTVIADLVFSTVASAIEEVCSSKPGVRASQFVIDFPVSHPSILRSFREHLQGLKKEAQSALQQPASPTIVALFESISSTPAIVLPWTDMVRICREENVWSIVDAAHSLGQEVGLELSVIDPDFWVTVRWISQLSFARDSRKFRTVVNGFTPKDLVQFFMFLSGECPS